MQRILGNGYELIGVGLDEDGIEHTGSVGPDLVLIGLEAVQEAALELCRRMAAYVRTGGIPVMVLFPGDNRGLADRALAAGVVYYSYKPLIPAIFAKRV